MFTYRFLSRENSGSEKEGGTSILCRHIDLEAVSVCMKVVSEREREREREERRWNTFLSEREQLTKFDAHK